MSNINEYGFPFNSVQYDRKYNAEEWRTYFSHLLDNGIIGQVTNELQVKPQPVPNKSVIIDKGAVFINGAMRVLDKAINLDISENTSGMDRIDRIVAQIDYNSREINFTVLQGTPGANPVPPTLIKSLDIWQLSLAQVYLANGYTTIVGDNITDERQDETVCGYFKYKAKPAWYPGGDIPMDVWKYVLFKEQLTAQEIVDIEGNASLMDIINNTTAALKSEVQQVQQNLDNAESSLQGNINQVQTNLDNAEVSLQSDITEAQTKLASIETGAQVNPTASEIITTIITVDGAGSGLDADRLDGQHGSYYAKTSDVTSLTNSVNDLTTSLNNNNKSIETNTYNIYALQLSQYYGGISYLHRLGFLDGFINTNVSNDALTTVPIYTSQGICSLPWRATVDNNVFEYTGTLDGQNWYIYNDSERYVGGTMDLSDEAQIKDITVKLRNTGIPSGYVKMDIYSGHGDDGTLLYTASNTIPCSSIPNAYTEYTFTFSDEPILSAGNYSFILSPVSIPSTSCILSLGAIDDTDDKCNLLYYYDNEVESRAPYVIINGRQPEVTSPYVYVTEVQDIGEDFNEVLLYFSAIEGSGNTITPSITCYTTTAGSFAIMTKDESYARDVGDGYTEYKYTYSTPLCSKIKLKFTISSGNVEDCIIREYGVITR